MAARSRRNSGQKGKNRRAQVFSRNRHRGQGTPGSASAAIHLRLEKPNSLIRKRRSQLTGNAMHSQGTDPLDGSSADGSGPVHKCEDVLFGIGTSLNHDALRCGSSGPARFGSIINSKRWCGFLSHELSARWRGYCPWRFDLPTVRPHFADGSIRHFLGLCAFAPNRRGQRPDA